MGPSSSWFAYVKATEKDRPQVTTDLLKRVWTFATPYQGRLIGLLITIVVISGLTVVQPLLFRDLIDNALPDKNGTRLNYLALGMVAIPVINGLVGVLQRHWSAQIGEGVICDLRQALYAHMQRMSLRFFTETRTGELMSRLNNDVIGAQQAITSTLMSILSNSVAVLITLTIMMVLEWRLTLIALIIVPLFVVSARSVARTLRDMRRQSMEYNAEMNALMNETLNVSGALLVKLFGRQADESRKFADRAIDVRDIGIKQAVTFRWFFLALSIASAIGTALVFWLGGWLVLRGSFSIGTIVAFGSYIRQMYGPLMSLANAPVEFAQSMVSFERVFEALDIPIEIEEQPDALLLDNVDGRIQFDNVSFRYQAQKSGLDNVERIGFGGQRSFIPKRGKAAKSKDDKKDGDQADEADETAAIQRIANREWALEALDFTIEPGELVAVVGPSGAGKTSLTYMLPRLYDPNIGSILIDGTDIREVQLASLANNIGMVTQETYLFFETIAANLTYARPSASYEEMVSAAKSANIHEFIMSLPDQYETVVGERGYRLSGGERQRIAIARVLLKNPRILVLDEATSSLDSISEALIQDALTRVMADRTSVVIAHRLSTVLSADKILVFDQGRLVEQGTHIQLLEQDGLYATLYHTQFKHDSGLLAVSE